MLEKIAYGVFSCGLVANEVKDFLFEIRKVKGDSMEPMIKNGDYVLINKIAEAQGFIYFWDAHKKLYDFGYALAKQREWIFMSKSTFYQTQVPRGHFWVERTKPVADLYGEKSIISHGFVVGNATHRFNWSDGVFFQKIDPGNDISKYLRSEKVYNS